MQSTNSEYGSPYLAVCHVTFTLFSPEPKAEQLTLEFINTTVFRNLAQGSLIPVSAIHPYLKEKHRRKSCRATWQYILHLHFLNTS